MSETIIRKMQMDEPDERRVLDLTSQGLIGRPVTRPDGPAKVAGTASYAGEILPEGTAFGVLVRATIAKGKVASLDEASATAMPGVLGVFTGERFLRNPAQGGADAAPVQGASEVAYFGQPIGLVVGETYEDARHAAYTMGVTYEPADDASVDLDTAKSERPDAKQLDQGDLDAAMAGAAHGVDVTYTTTPDSSAPMEPHASVASWDEEGVLTLRGSYQMLRHNRIELADALGIETEKVRILAPFVGGGFGSKLGIAPEAVAASIAAKALKRPVVVAMTRQHVFEGTIRRSETSQRMRLCTDADGRLTGFGHDSKVSNLPGESFSEPLAMTTHFLYRGENRRIGHEIRRVNRTCAGSVRAPGEAPGMLATECAMDELAEVCGLDPIELRKRNIPDQQPENGTPYGTRLLAECLEEGAHRFGWADRKAPGERREGEWLIGMGVASAARTNMTAPASARVTLRADGTALVETDMTDIGTGTYAILTQIAGEMLGLPADRVEVTLGDTDFPPGSGSGGSWGASSTGAAVMLACEAVREQVCLRMGVEPSALTMRDGEAMAGNTRRTLEEVVGDEPVAATGDFEPGSTTEQRVMASYGAHFAEVAVNQTTGEVRVRRMLGVFSAGRILNERTARSQCIGGMIWGIGEALTEDLVHDPRDGHVVNRDLAEYHVPVNLDAPPIEIAFLEELEDWGSPIQSKGIGELGICGSGAAIGNAIYNACGVRIRDFPATPDKVLAGIISEEEAGRLSSGQEK
ncbi:xanthine dehydrogenase family protein molybdopterin-binding subunit [Parvularcula dongshanensis]|uniref:Xanthine dehydrogenase YagR molybdenum-binding subunit n=1 Tax=Parvularcula dongshanensis TaxID=1173995 RepID=A0A840HZS0_9PROT|nr:xanthine dehydrogenase family protein molybdopterin-binding subunit [Parvularcula dongshanensis]MBB4657531.1 xanthine dehydrogenase YagR molybdenum-binding subunit [Parvularcula dongshanensis]